MRYIYTSEKQVEAFLNLPEVLDLLEQVKNGLVSALEYADRIMELAYREGIIA